MAEEELARKKRLRTAQRAATTRIITQLKELIEEAEVDIARLAHKRSALLSKREIILKLDNEILNAIPESELDTEIERADDVQEQMSLAVMEIDRILKKKAGSSRPGTPEISLTSPRARSLEELSVSTGHTVSTPETTTTTTAAITTSMVSIPTVTDIFATTSVRTPSVSVSSPVDAHHVRAPIMSSGGTSITADTVSSATPGARVKLPELTIRRFNGDLTKWCTFWDMFESSIHNNPALSSVDKFNYLLSLLESSAAEAVSGLALTAANYDEAVATLKKRFGNKQLIVSRHMDVLMNLEAVTSQHNTRGLRRLFDSVEAQVRGLKALGISSESYGSLLSSILLNKLPPEIRLIVSRGLAEETWDLDQMLRIFETELNARERATATLPVKKSLPGRIPPTAASFITPATLNCVYCGQSHSSSECTTVPSVEARKQSLKRSGRCFVCLRRNHISRNCRSSAKCNRCHGKHHSSLCSQSPASCNGASDSSSPVSNPTSSSSTPVLYVNSKTPVLLQTARVVIHAASKSRPTVKTRAVLDCGSQRTYLTSRIQQTLALPTSSVEMVLINTFGSREGMKQPCNVVKFGIITKDGRSTIISALVVPHICDSIYTHCLEVVRECYPHLANLDLADAADTDESTVELLIGADFYWSLATGRVERGTEGPAAVETKVGWVLSGPMEREVCHHFSSSVPIHSFRVDTEIVGDVDENLRRFWDLESLGVTSKEKCVQERFTQEISFNNNRYEVSLPWREGHPKLPDNYEICFRRLTGLIKRLRQNPDLLRAYDDIIQEQLKAGIVEKVQEGEPPQGHKRIHYLPHHPVVREDKSTSRVRIVYDASCKSRGPSLNECLHVGPNFGQYISDIVIRFRVHKVALVGDIEKAFLMINVTDRDRDALRFLWYDNPRAFAPSVVKLRFTRVMFGVSSSPFLLNATLRCHIEKYKQIDPDFVEKFIRCIYVDDLTSGACSDESAYEFYEKSKSRLAEAGFNLRKFVSNSAQLIERIALNEGVPADTHLNPKECRVLGVVWSPPDDQLRFNIQSVVELLLKVEATKRNIIGIAAKIYDPIGILSPLTICFKMFFQQLCKARLGWDDELNGDLRSKWQHLTSQFSQASSASTCIPRQLSGLDKAVVSHNLVGFCDASKRAYAAVVYLRVHAEEGGYSSILISKTRVAPLKEITIPRLELLSALLLARLVHSVCEALGDEIQLEPPICFTDSRVALCWIRRVDKEWKQFIENRVAEIRKLVPPQNWRHCPGVENPADMPSRGVNPTEFQNQQRVWLKGPEWIVNVNSSDYDEDEIVPEECLKEMRSREMKLVNLLVSTGLSNVINIEKYGKFEKLLRVTAQVLRFIRILKARSSVDHELTVQDISSAHTHLVRLSQTALPENKNFTIWSRQFGLFKDANGIWRCRGRLENADISYDMKFPMFLHKGSALTRLIVIYCHERVKHSGVNCTLAELRTRYWVVHGRQLVKQLIYNCVLCRRLQCNSYQPPPPPPLPLIRVDTKPPFSYTGIDFAGPLYVRETLNSNSRKVWICLYTCCVIRAVHLDLVVELTSQAFLRSFKRFTARRGIPIRILSDNGKTFKAASKTISAILSHPSVRSHLLNNQISWQFNVERAPWWGGVFERMVQSTKRCLKRIIGSSRLTFDELYTAVIEVESMLNCRPLTYISSDEMVEPLTPSHLLVGRRILTLPDVPTDVEDDDYVLSTDPNKLTRRMKHLSKTLEKFWTRWKCDYLLELRNSHRNQGTPSQGSSVATGDVVVIHDEHQPRGLWKLGVVTKLMTGKDDEVRAVCVKTQSKDGKLMVLRRPIQKLYPLEVRDTDIQRPSSAVEEPSSSEKIVNSTENLTEKLVNPAVNVDESVNVAEGSVQPFISSRPKRNATKRARERITAWIKDLHCQEY